MDNTHNKSKNENKQHEVANAELIKMPKNIRQIGTIGSHNKIIYVEDYVMTFIKQLSDKDYSDCKVAVLLGYYSKVENKKSLFIKGALEMKDVDFSSSNPFSDEAWTTIYENIKRYFTNVEIVGWALIAPEFVLDNGERLRKVQSENFSGQDKVLIKIDGMEKEETFYMYDNNQLIKQSGYYIYYEKNEEMQNYMVDNREGVCEEKRYEDKTTQKIRTVIKEKKDSKEDKNSIRLMYAACSLLVLVVIIAAASINAGQFKKMQTAINTLSENLNKVSSSQSAKNEKATDDTKSTKEKSTNNDQTTDLADTDKSGSKDNTANSEEQETMEVETISGNVVKSETVEDANSTTKETNNTTDETKGITKGSNNTTEETTDTEKNDNKNKANNTKKVDSNRSAQDANQTEKAKSTNQNNQKATKDNASTTKPVKNASTKTEKDVKYYTVQPGESLAGICFKLYNSGNYIDKIKELNGIVDENKILAGQKLIVP